MRPAVQSLTRQLSGNPRLQIGLALILVLVFAFAFKSLHGWRVAQQAEAIDKEVELRQTRSLRGQDVWLKRAEQTATARKALLAEIPIVATPGLAQASLQSWLRQAGNSVSASASMNIDVSAPVEMEDYPGIYRTRATVNALLTPRQSFDLMNMVESAGNLAVVETAQVRADKGSRTAITLVGYYRTGGDGAPQ